MNRKNAAVITLLAACGLAQAQVASAQLREGDTVDGNTVTAINNSGANGIGGYSFTISTDNGVTTISKIWGSYNGGPGATIVSEATYNDRYEQTGFESFFGMGNSSVTYSPTVNDLATGATGLDTVWKDITPVLSEEDPVGGEFSSFNSRPGITRAGTPHWVGGLTSTQGGSTQDRALFYDGNIVIRGGDAIPGIGNVSANTIDFDYRFSGAGTNWICPIDIDGAASSADIVIVVSGNAYSAGGSVVQEGSLVAPAAGGLPGELWVNFDSMGINEAGDVFFTGDTSTDPLFDEFVFKNGAIALREGTAVTGGTIAGSIESGYMNEDGDWAVTWDLDTDAGNIEVLIVNGEVVLRENDPVDWNGDGTIDGGDSGAFLTDFTGIASVTVGDRQGDGSFIVAFTADCNVGGSILEGGFVLTIPGTGCPADLTGSSDPN
ncbi:MAG: hypothetical protein ACF8SC_07190, partial [Phycisphaerales bacterium JB037]